MGLPDDYVQWKRINVSLQEVTGSVVLPYRKYKNKEMNKSILINLLLLIRNKLFK